MASWNPDSGFPIYATETISHTKELAEKIGVSASQLSRIVSGERGQSAVIFSYRCGKGI